MKRLLTAAAAVAALAAAAGPTAAQVAGTYSGTSADGNGVSFTVATDPNNGDLAITSASISISALCSDGSTFNTGWGFGFSPLPDIINHKVTSKGGGPYLTTDLNLTFSADNQSAKGFILEIVPTLTPVGPAPKKALICRTKRQTMGVNLQPGGAKVAPPADGTMTTFKPAV